jgi:5'-nucleotidase
MIKQRIAIDMDDVMAATAQKMLNLYNTTFEKNIQTDDFKKQSFHELVEQDKYQVIREEIFKVGFFRDIEVMPHAQEIIQALHEKYDIFIVSAATEFPNSLKEKLEWLNEFFPYISWKNIVFCGDKSIISADFMIDDHEKNLSTFRGKAMLFDAIHNQQITDFQRFNSWKEIGEYLL